MAEKTHGKTNTKLFKKWMSIKYRCYNENCHNYHRYGGRGITVCEQWLENFMNFYNWAILNDYKDGLTIERIDVNGNYEPSNCTWATLKEQANNRVTSTFIEYLNEKRTIAQWSDILGIPQVRISKRLTDGWSVERTLTTHTKYIKNTQNEK